MYTTTTTTRIGAGLLLLLVTALLAQGCDDKGGVVDPADVSTLTVALSGIGTGTVTSQPAGIDCGTTDGDACSAEFDAGTEVTLTAAPAAGMAFLGWSDACAGTASCSVTVDAATTVGAGFDNPDMAVQAVGAEGGTVTSRDGLLTLTIPAGALSADEQISIERVDATELGSGFEDVEVGSAYEMGPDGLTFDMPITVTLPTEQQPVQADGSLQLTAVLLLTSEVDSVVALDSLRVEMEGDSVVARGEMSHFSLMVMVEIDDARTLTARVTGVPDEARVGAEMPVSIVLSAGDDAPVAGAWYYSDYTGAIYTDNQGISYLPEPSENEFADVILHACRFSGPGGYISQVNVVLEGVSRTSRLKFNKMVTCLDPRLTVTLSGTGTGRVVSDPAGIDCSSAGGTCAAEFAAHSAVDLLATPDDGSTFLGWSGCAATILMNADRTCDAEFAVLPPPPPATFISLPLHMSEVEALGIILADGGFFASPPHGSLASSFSMSPADTYCPDVMVAGTGGAGIVNSCTGEVVRDYSGGSFEGDVYFDALFLPVPEGQSGDPAVLFSGQGYFLCGLDENGEPLDFCQSDFNNAYRPDASVIGNDPANGAAMVNDDLDAVDLVLRDAGSGGFVVHADVGNLSELPLRSFESVATNAQGDKMLVVGYTSSIGAADLYFVELDPADPSADAIIVRRELGLHAAPRRIRCDLESQLCAISHFGGSSSTRRITIFLWDGETMPDDSVGTPMSIVSVDDGLANGPVGIDVVGNRIVTAGYWDNQYSIIEVDLSDATLGRGDALPYTITSAPLPAGCEQPGHAVFLRDVYDSILASCNGSDGIALVPEAF